MFWTHILDVLGSYPSRDTGCFNKFLMVLLWQVLGYPTT
jgi:hypothetical protein